jgi:hypothetical protein
VFQSRIRRTPAGEIGIDLPDEERALLRHVAAELTALLGDDRADPSLRRLFPPAYEDESREREYRELTRTQLRSGREQALQVLRETADRQLLSDEEADAWLRALNDVRLDVTEDFDWEAVGPGHPDAPQLALYAYLSWLQEQLVEAL